MIYGSSVGEQARDASTSRRQRTAQSLKRSHPPLAVPLLLCIPERDFFQIMSTPRRSTSPGALEGVVPAVASFLERPSLWVKHACLTLLHRMVTRNDIGAALVLAKGER